MTDRGEPGAVAAGGDGPGERAGPGRLTEPLETLTSGIGVLLLAGLLLSLGATIAGSSMWSFGGFGRHVLVCATSPMTKVGVPTRHLGLLTRSGAYLNLNAPVGACASHPGIGQRVLYTLTSLPSGLVWIAVLLLLWRLLRLVRRHGPFAPKVAGGMRALGWVILTAPVAAAAIEGLATDLLLHMLLTGSQGFADAASRAISSLPVAVLAGVGVLVLARIIRIGTAMDDEIKATV